MDVRTVIDVLRAVGPHGVRDDPATRGLDVFEYFAGRDLKGCDFTGIPHALGVSFAGSDLRQADLRGVHLHGADLRQADLRGADARGSRMTADFGGARLRGLLLDDAELSRCRFSGTSPDIARCAAVVACEFVGVDFSYLHLLGGSFGGDLQACDLTGAVAGDIAISGTWTGCELSEMLVRKARPGGPWVLVDCRGDGVRLPGAALDSVEMIDCRLPSLQADAANLSRSILVGSDLSGASLAGASLAGADLERVVLVGADLRGADLSGASFDDVDLTDALLDPGALEVIRSSGKGSRGRSDR